MLLTGVVNAYASTLVHSLLDDLKPGLYVFLKFFVIGHANFSQQKTRLQVFSMAFATELVCASPFSNGIFRV